MSFSVLARTSVAAALALPLLIASPAAHADRRAFGYTYEYNTLPKEGLELELWNTQARSTFGAGGASSIDWQVEVEYGITDHWDISVYQGFGQVNGPDAASSEPLGYAETKVETRYRFAERGEWPVDVLVYGELNKAFGVASWEIEPKVVIARDFAKLNVAANLTPEVKIEKVDAVETAFQPGWSLGASYEVSPRWKVGAETFGVHEDGATFAAAGPSLSWSPSEKLYVATTGALGLTDATEKFALRFVVGVGL